jgi:Holliday junction resolvasome RuvABC endonuclease subunit
MIILGIDPGYAIVGFGVIGYSKGKFTPIEYGSITQSKEKYNFGKYRHVVKNLSK